MIFQEIHAVLLNHHLILNDLLIPKLQYTCDGIILSFCEILAARTLSCFKLLQGTCLSSEYISGHIYL